MTTNLVVVQLDVLASMLRGIVRDEIAARGSDSDEGATVDETMRELRLSRRGVQRLIRLGRLRASRVGPGVRGRLLIERASIRELMARGIG